MQKTKKAKKSNGTTFRLNWLPPPSRTLTAKQAADWLEGPQCVYTEMLQSAEQGGLLGIDLVTMLEACAAGIRDGSLGLRRSEEAENAQDANFICHLGSLAALALLPVVEGPDHDV